MAIYGEIGEIIKQNKFERKICLALEYLAGLDRNFLSDKPAGYLKKVEIDGRDIFAIHQVSKTKPPRQARFEAHRKYIDLQYILGGEEIIGIAFVNKLTIILPYDRKKDVEFYKYFPSTSFVMEPGALAIFYPCDAHAPGLIFKRRRLVRKVVVKVRAMRYRCL